jgi:hypothetical protein
MTTSIRTRFIAAAALAVGALGLTSAAHARSDVFFSIGLQAPSSSYYVQPDPVYVQPRPVYVQPQPIYSPRPVYVAPAQVYGYQGVQPGYEYSYRDERAARRAAEWRRAQWERRHDRHDRYDRYDRYDRHERNERNDRNDRNWDGDRFHGRR